MGGFLTGDDEELLRSFRPHVLSYVSSYALALLWLLWSLPAVVLPEAVGAAWGFWLGYATFLLLVLMHGYVRYRLRSAPHVLALHAIVAAIVTAGMALDSMGLILPASFSRYDPLAVAGVVAAASLVTREAKRHATRTYLTTQRIVTRQGLAPRTESVLLLSDVGGMETRQGMLGSLFGFGRIRLVKGKRRRSRTTKKGTEEVEEDDILEVRGVPGFERVRRDLGSLVQETRLSDKERRRRIEERRLKDSMARVARWHPPRGT